MEENNDNDFELDVYTEIIDIADDIRTIKRWVTFFGILIILALISGFTFYLLIFLGLRNSFIGF